MQLLGFYTINRNRNNKEDFMPCHALIEKLLQNCNKPHELLKIVIDKL